MTLPCCWNNRRLDCPAAKVECIRDVVERLGGTVVAHPLRLAQTAPQQGTKQQGAEPLQLTGDDVLPLLAWCIASVGAEGAQAGGSIGVHFVANCAYLEAFGPSSGRQQ